MEAGGQAPLLPRELPYSFADLNGCNKTSAELVAMSSRETEIDRCILYNTLPSLANNNQTRTTVITAVGVFTSSADIHRDGGLIAAQKINEDNEGQGAAIGYYRDHYIQFRLVIGVAGNREQMGPDNY